MKSLLFFLSFTLGFQAIAPASAHENEAGFYTTDPGQEDGVLADFVADLKAGKVEGLKNVAIQTSGNSRIELRVAEQIMANTSARVIHCLACKKPNADLKKIAKVSGIDHFLDIDYEGTKERQDLKLKITQASDQKEVWSAKYYHDQQEMREMKVKVDRGVVFTAFANATLMPKEHISSMEAFGLGARAQLEGWGLEVDAERTTESDSSFHFLALKAWEMKHRRDEFWIAAGATYLTGDRQTWGWVARAGYDWYFSRQWIAGIWMGDRPSSPYAGLEAGLRLGYAF